MRIFILFVVLLFAGCLTAPTAQVRAAELPAMLVIPAGSVTVGAYADDPAASDDEFPQRTVTLANDFRLGITPVTRGAFAQFVQATGHVADSGCWVLSADGWVLDPSASWQAPGFDQTDNHPVTCVSRTDALAYLNWLSLQAAQKFRLPTEAEWTHAAGAPAYWGTPYDICIFGNVNDITAKNKVAKAAEPCTDGAMHTSPVGSYAANPNGLHDMIGNVWEWMADCHAGGYDALPVSGAAQHTADTCDAYALRGHSWTDAPGPVRLETRYALPADARQSMVGFRVAADVAPSDD